MALGNLYPPRLTLEEGIKVVVPTAAKHSIPLRNFGEQFAAATDNLPLIELRLLALGLFHLLDSFKARRPSEVSE